ncbi:MAG TPA: hypothetical protein DEF85_10485 [Clostridiaceae bacterium]|jgi:cell division protein FtsA|nr:hypothetical protein [Clostridiaceae bacterium]HBF77676.1 hypothetical protein [Clostridiaceae bacterium]HBG37708.1 hypothetical protein [Clostridiaceae bacterium]HBN29021.1 hypothetical protein [Clostridiaceae bacterium]HBX49303.1 hypothetical protein [Clostridiaceae bacterium]
MKDGEIVFALDIGTRTVIGIVGEVEGENYKVLAVEKMEHKSRTIIDGQVSDIEKVAEVAEKVKENLEKKLDIKLSKVAIAAAGRVLKTMDGEASKEIKDYVEINQEMVNAIEIEAVQTAQKKLTEELKEDEKDTYYCVGYTVNNYFLNDFIIKSLIGQKGKKMSIQVLATFLPQTVVSSLYAVMKKIGLEVISLTLEPIAAINVVVPDDIRLLNIALVDVGAGTSDIAITKEGSVVAYGMVPIAGDEITEAICQNYIVDFNTGENIKISLSSMNSDEVKFTDVLGMKNVEKKEKIQEVVQPVIDSLADEIVNNIINLNKKAPNAVILVGGGSQIKGLGDKIANKLNMPVQRVAVRGREAIRNLIMEEGILDGPDSITPIGIFVSYCMQKSKNFINVKLNGEKLKIYNTSKITVADALILTGFEPKSLIGKNGEDLIFHLNNQKIIIRGEIGKSAEIYVNDKMANIRTQIFEDDNIVVLKGYNGSSAALTVEELRKKYIDDDAVIFVNGDAVGNEYLIKNNDYIQTTYKNQNLSNKNDVKKTSDDNTLKDKEVLYVTVNDKKVKLDGKNHIFIDIFNYIDFDIKKPNGSIVLKLNGKNAGYMDEIKDGDKIEIYWDKK